ncbi:MAG TPA: hypothetical protein ENJ30_09040 [Desulfobulbaceae bacterium]|nr:hypothetical protein [Desulfobulbaceae bacterium]
MRKNYSLNLPEIQRSLRKVQRNFESINEKLHVRRDPLEDIIVENMLLGYTYIDRLLGKNINLLHRRGLHHILELNHIVLCGGDLKTRKEFHQHVTATTDRFYSQKECNIGKVVSVYNKWRDKSAWKKAAAVYIYLISQPQLFYEGNHRTGALLMSYILAGEGKPPFVLSVDNAEAYFNPSTLAKLTRKSMVTKMWKLPKIQKKFAKFLKKQGSEKFLIPR